MRRTFNYTGRRRIPRSAVSITVFAVDDIRNFQAHLQLADQGLPVEARVFVEAYYERAFARFDFGTVGAVKPPANCSLREIDFGRRVLFRVKVVDPRDGFGRVLAVADGLVPLDADDNNASRQSLLEVDPRSDMGDEIWRIDFSSSGPVLQVNTRIENVMQLFRDNSVIRALVYPEVLRSILGRILLQDPGDSVDTEDEWQGKWLKFAGRLLGAPTPDVESDQRSAEELSAWIEQCISEFATKLRARESVADAIAEGRL